MSLITPDFGLLFWMVVIFGIVFFLLAKFGFPVITNAVQKRSDHIADSLKAADEAQARLAGMAEEHARMIEETRLEQSRILKEASEARESIIAQAREEAAAEASKLLEHVAGRIASNIFRSFPEAALVDLKITKVNPPMGAHCDGASVVMSFERTPDDSLAESC